MTDMNSKQPSLRIGELLVEKGVVYMMRRA
jgi:hypothetical protein